MKKAEKKKMIKRGPNPKLAYIECCLCGSPTAEVRLTHNGKHPYIHCNACDNKITGSMGVAYYVINVLKRTQWEAIGEWTERKAKAKLLTYCHDFEERSIYINERTQKAHDKGEVHTTPVWATMHCPLCLGKNSAVVRLTTRRSRPYWRCYRCHSKSIGILGVFMYLDQRPSKNGLQVSEKIGKNTFRDVLENAVQDKLEKIKVKSNKTGK